MSFSAACARARRLSAKRQCIYFVFQGDAEHEFTVARDTPETEEWFLGETPSATYEDGTRID
jgi:hypothetical protein